MPRPEELAQLVFLVRGEKVIFDADLAKLYGVSTKALNQAMNRNKARFPEDFAFRLSQAEFKDMRSQIVTSTGQASIRIHRTSCGALTRSAMWKLGIKK